MMTGAVASEEGAAGAVSLFDQYHAAIFAYLYRLLNDREQAQELTQETFLRTFDARARLPRIENRRAWVYRIATNLAFNQLKRHKRFAWLPWRKVDDLHLHQPDIAVAVESQIRVEAALDALPLEYRAPLLLYAQEGFSVREIAEALGINEGAVKTRLLRARERFWLAYERGNDL